VLTSTAKPMEAAMPSASIPVHSPAPAPEGPIACTLHPNEFAGRWDDFDRAVFAHLARMERPEPARLRLVLSGDADPGAVRELLVREQACCAFLSFTLTPGDGQLLADLEVPAEAAPALDGLARLAGRSAR
jgi:hypothetical protein